MNRFYLILVLGLIFSINGICVKGQEGAVPDTSSLELNVIPVSQITGRATELNTFLRDKRSSRMSSEEKYKMVTSVDTLVFRLSLLREDPRIQQIPTLNFRSIEDLQTTWTNMQSLLLNWQTDLTLKVDEIENDKVLFAQITKLWSNTKVSASDNDAPQSVISQIDETEHQIKSILDSLKSDSEFIQDELVKISNGLIFCNTLLGDLNLTKDQVTREIFELTQPPVWKLFNTRGDTIVFRNNRSYLDDVQGEIKQFVTENTLRLIIHFLLLIIIIFSLGALYKDIVSKIPDRDEKEINTIRKIIKRPISSSILTGFLLTYIFYSSLPAVLILLNTIILLVPVILILSDLIVISSRRFVIIPLLALVLIQFHSLGYSETLFSRLFIISIIVVSLIYISLFYRSKQAGLLILNSNTRKVLKIYSVLAIFMLFIAFIGAVTGAVMLAEFLTYAIIKSASLILIIYALTLTLNSILFTLIYSKGSQQINIVAQYKAEIFKKTSSTIIIVGWVLWIVFTLRLFNVWSQVSQFLKDLLSRQLIEDVEIGGLVLFIIILVITFWLSRLMKIIIEGEIAPRIKMKRGVPGALALLMRIGIITIGFFFAAGVAGFGMQKMTILLGALGVGIGFGLQNIFNNLVSGIILAFERPIQEGDIIEVGELWGTVKEIGIRSSTIFTFDGAEVIVPNGNLISNELINWTLTDRNRRVEVVIGVAYGTDPDAVIEILKEVSDSHEDILKEPAPLALFSGFGDSSLDFRILFWIARADNRFVIHSQVNIEINKALKKAGIEVPFPQSDIHIKSGSLK